MRKKIITSLFVSLIMVSIVLPHVVTAVTIIPCDGVVKQCGLKELLELGKNIMTVVVMLAIPFMTIILTWVGVLILTAQGNVGRIERAKQIAWNTIIGFVFILTAWIIVHTITAAFLKDDYRLFF